MKSTNKFFAAASLTLSLMAPTLANAQIIESGDLNGRSEVLLPEGTIASRYKASLSPLGNLVAWADASGKIHVLELKSRVEKTYSYACPFLSCETMYLHFSPDSSHLFIHSWVGVKAWIIDLHTNKVSMVEIPDNVANDIIFTTDSSRIIATTGRAYPQRHAAIINLKQPKTLAMFPLDGQLTVVGQTMAIVDRGFYEIFNLDTGLSINGKLKNRTSGWTVSPDGKTLYTSEYDSEEFAEIDTATGIRKVLSKGNSCLAMKYLVKRGEIACSGTESSSSKLYLLEPKTATQKLEISYPRALNALPSVSFSKDENSFFLFGDDSILFRNLAQADKNIAAFGDGTTRESKEGSSYSASDTMNRVAYRSPNCAARFKDLQTRKNRFLQFGKQVGSTDGYTCPGLDVVVGIDLSSDGNIALTTFYGGAVVLTHLEP